MDAIKINGTEQLELALVPDADMAGAGTKEYDLDRIIFDLDTQIEALSSSADQLDYLISIASGLLCGALDILWVGDFSLERGRAMASDKVDGFVKKREGDSPPGYCYAAALAASSSIAG